MFTELVNGLIELSGVHRFFGDFVMAHYLSQYAAHIVNVLCESQQIGYCFAGAVKPLSPTNLDVEAS